MYTREISLIDTIKKYPLISPFIIIKIDAQRRGIEFSKAALSKVDPDIHQVKVRSFSREQKGLYPVALMLRDGTSIITRNNDRLKVREPLEIDVVDDDIVIRDQGKILEKVFYWEKPDYYDKETRRGIPMWKVVNARPQRLDINPYQFCHLWEKNMGCKFCGIAGTYRRSDKPSYLEFNDIDDTITEALKEYGRFTNVFLTGGMVTTGKVLFDDEVNYYIKVLEIIGKHFKTKKFPSQLLGAPYNEEQLKRIYNNTGLMSYSANIEVLNKEKFDWICPGKSAFVGYEKLKERLYKAVDVFGKGYVNTGIVCGVEMAKPYGFSSEEEGIEKTLEEAEKLMKYGVDVVSCVWRVAQESIFFKQKSPSLEYYVKIVQGLDNLRNKYNLCVDMDNYRRCGNHPDTDLSRIW